MKTTDSVKQLLKKSMSIRFETSGSCGTGAYRFSFAGVGAMTCRGGEAESVATSHLVDLVAANRAPIYESSVGFKSIGESINEDRSVPGGEESTRPFIKGHYQEKDGILASLLAAEAIAAHGSSLTEQFAARYERTAKLEATRIGIQLKPQLISSIPGKTPTALVFVPIEKSTAPTEVSFCLQMVHGRKCLHQEPNLSFEPTRNQNQQIDLEVLLEQGGKFLLG